MMHDRGPRIGDSIIFFLLLSGPPRLRARDVTAALRMEIDWAVLLQLTVWGVACLWLIAQLYPLVVARGLVPRVWVPQVIGAAFCLALFASVWIAPGFVPTVYAISQVVILLAFSWTFVQRFGPDAFVRHLFWGYLLLAAAIVVAWMAMPELVIRRDRVRGDLIAPAGAVAAMGLVLCCSGLLRLSRRTLFAVAGLFLLVLAASQTRTAFVAVFVFVLIGWAFRCPSPIKKATPAVMLLVLGAALVGYLPMVQLFIIREHRSIATLSERIPLWSFLIETTLRESPLIGLGYHSAIRLLAPQFHPRIGDAHSVFVEVFVGGGLIGLVLFSLLCLSLVLYTLRLVLHWRDSQLALSVVGLFAVTVTLSLTTSVGIQSGPIGFTFWSLTALLPATLQALRTMRYAPDTRRPDGLAHAELAA